jgi:hypothetical protein
VIYLVKIHGNWCGPKWTGGQKVDAKDYTGSWSYPAISKLDKACRAHDKACASRGDKGCCASDDRKLVRVAIRESTNPINILFKPLYAATANAVANGINVASSYRKC